MSKCTVLLADDHNIVRKGMRMMLELEKDLVVVGEAKNGREAVQLAEALEPDVILMDIAMPVLNGLEATRQLLKVFPRARVIALSAHNDDAYVINAIQSGAMGYLLKQDSMQNVCRAIRDVMNGHRYFSHSVDVRLRKLRAAAVLTKAPLGIKLTSREMEVLQLVAEGEANKQIAAELAISIKTVEKHRTSLMKKLNIHDTAGLTRFAIAQGIIESSSQNTVI